MIGIYFFGIIIFISVIFYFTNVTITKPNKNVILSTTLPISELDNDEVLKIVQEFKKSNKICFLISISIYIPSLIINPENITESYFCIWLFFELILNYFLLKKYITKLRTLKANNNWFLEKKHTISVDTEVSKLKNKMPISILWFIPAFAITLGLILCGINIKDDRSVERLVLGLSSLVTLLILLIIYKLLSAEKTKVYSNDTNINLACNLVYRRTWSIVLVLTSTIESFFIFLVSFMFSYTYVISFMVIILTVIPIFLGYTKIRDTQNKLLMAIDNVIYADDDEYWGIMFYNNPNDSNLMVEKRIGLGMTMNMGHPKAKIISYGLAIFILITLLPIFFLKIKLINVNFNILLNDKNIKIEAPLYGSDFNKEDVEDISIISSFPGGNKTNGAETGSISLGNYTVKGYGKSKVYVHKKLDRIILIKLSDKYVFFNGNNDEETNSYYTELKSYLNMN
ncbi:DUF5808 domain-containing protein [Clostridium sp. SHJSY1]|uniref:DUF5808 domain-containing protein n=1 Tax=Clostridium sp. SHJSY1 TaxID=2942483 RepID=UPI00287582CD|nr:DUF5808 domain-containing protein [Clostridium sp. SHJSY1]MDS0524587.1 DUF5808 domain-containing protein [Clostridium sp. SHJSY1]